MRLSYFNLFSVDFGKQMASSQVTKAFMDISGPNFFTYIVLTAGRVTFYVKPVRDRFE